jgi:hypothetical protein
MPRRSSVKKAEWSGTREEHYRKECEEMLFHRNLKLHTEGDHIYLKSENFQTFLTTILKPKTLWYEIWLKLREVYANGEGNRVKII